MVRIGKVSMANADLLKFNLMHICEKKMSPYKKSSLELEIEKERIEFNIKNEEFSEEEKENEEKKID